VKPASGRHPQSQTERARALCREVLGEVGEARRAEAIAQLPVVQWKGRTLYTIRCHGDFGNGPHDQHVPEATLWALISLSHYRCAYHRT
jgi:hypothetical protein